MIKLCLPLVCILLCGMAATREDDFMKSSESMSKDSIQKHTLEIAGHKVDVWLPGQPPKGCILLLPGWNFSRTDWCERSSMCTQALQRGFALVMPEMGKSVYAEQLFPETRPDWRQYPTRPWLREQVIEEVRARFGLLKPGQNNFVVGLSTGARGAALLCLDMPGFWKGAALLSGDYDQTKMPSDNLMRGYYGSYQQFAERWKTVDNVIHRILEWRTPVYIGHGRKDKVVPPAQSQHLCEVLRKVYPQLTVECHFPLAGHDYTYWDSEVKPVLDFLESLL
jgi:pimeloyl-ACP methyl ester carboxylesterase